jgi:transaldolase
MSRSRLEELSDHGQSVWIDYLSRDLLRSGALARMVEEDAVVGVTSNPTIFERALADTDAYDGQLAERAPADGGDDKEVFLELAARDVADACDLLLPVWERSGGRDGWVSIEVDPRLAYDSPATVDEAEGLHGLIARPNRFVKIPATRPGLVAIEEMIARGRSINVTLLFSLERHAAVVESYLSGLERLIEAGRDPSSVWSVASFFVSRVDTEVDDRLAAMGAGEGLARRLAVANAKLAYRQYQRAFSGERWAALAASGAHPQRCLWASTSMKDPRRRDTSYVEQLIGPETIATMPEQTIRAFQDHGRVEPTLEADVREAERLLERLARVGVDYEDVVDTLEADGVEKFERSFADLLAGLHAKRAAVGVSSAGRR